MSVKLYGTEIKLIHKMLLPSFLSPLLKLLRWLPFTGVTAEIAREENEALKDLRGRMALAINKEVPFVVQENDLSFLYGAAKGLCLLPTFNESSRHMHAVGTNISRKLEAEYPELIELL